MLKHQERIFTRNYLYHLNRFFEAKDRSQSKHKEIASANKAKMEIEWHIINALKELAGEIDSDFAERLYNEHERFVKATYPQHVINK